jgi:hypothetical protein
MQRERTQRMRCMHAQPALQWLRRCSPPLPAAAQVLTAKISGRILKQAREQQLELEEDQAEESLLQRLGPGGSAAKMSAGEPLCQVVPRCH